VQSNWSSAQTPDLCSHVQTNLAAESAVYWREAWLTHGGAPASPACRGSARCAFTRGRGGFICGRIPRQTRHARGCPTIARIAMTRTQCIVVKGLMFYPISVRWLDQFLAGPGSSCSSDRSTACQWRGVAGAAEGARLAASRGGALRRRPDRWRPAMPRVSR
jgi:hypothetical protein